MKNTKFLRLTWRNWKQTSKEDYMKKWMVMMLALSLFAPAFAGDDSAKGENPSPKQRRKKKDRQSLFGIGAGLKDSKK